MSLRSLFVDFNSYFASVEQQADPTLRGRPVGVVPVMAETTCCIAASVEAKTFGVCTGTMVREARKLCPQIALVLAQPPLYVEYHHRLKEAIETCIPIDFVGSIDEVGCELIGRERVRTNAVAIARNIKSAVRGVGDWLRCSVGIAPNHFLSKTATDMQKPDGLVVLEESDLPHALYQLELSDLCGIGPAMEQRLHAQGICSVEQLCALDAPVLRDVWGGIEGERFFDALRGQWQAHRESARASLGHSHVLGPPWRTPAGARAVLKKLLVKAAMRLRHEGYVAQALSVRVRHLGAGAWHGEIRFDATDDSREFLRQLAHALEQRDRHTLRLPLRDARPLAVSVTLHRLQRRDESTAGLFVDEAKTRALNGVLDRINRRYGGNTLYFGSMQAALDAAPMRIPFSTIPDTQLECDSERSAPWRQRIRPFNRDQML
ncbi:MAG: DNA polymerase [Proteobacteria bacterium]|nr:DNA polymerase [Pseudomonadota bacterium]